MRPSALGESPLTLLEPRVVPTVIAGPNYDPAAGVTATLTENSVAGVGVSVTAHITNTSSTTETVAFASYDNATVGPTATGGPHNAYNQQRTAVDLVQLAPGACVCLTLCEDPGGETCGQVTGTQFDVYCVPSSQLCGMTTCQQEDYLAPETFTPENIGTVSSHGAAGIITYSPL